MSTRYIASMIYHKYRNKVDFAVARLRRMILSGTLEPGTRLASSVELAKEFGVSPMTADRAVRRLAAEGCLKRITGCGTFVCSGSGKKRICVMDPPVRDSFHSGDKYRIMDSESLIYYENTYPIIDSEFLKYDVEVKYAKSWEAVRDLKPDGILSSQVPPSDFEPDVPIALFRHYELLNEPLIQCVPDLGKVMCRICSMLIRKKVRRIYVSANPDPRIRYFADSFLGWTDQLGLRSRVEYSESGVTRKVFAYRLGYQFGMALKQVRGCAIFTTSDFRAAGILNALDDRMFRPGEYDLISCSNWEAFGFRPFPHPRLTSIDFRREECLREVVRLLCDSVRAPGDGQIRIAKYPAFLKIRESGLR